MSDTVSRSPRPSCSIINISWGHISRYIWAHRRGSLPTPYKLLLGKKCLFSLTAFFHSARVKTDSKRATTLLKNPQIFPFFPQTKIHCCYFETGAVHPNLLTDSYTLAMYFYNVHYQHEVNTTRVMPAIKTFKYSWRGPHPAAISVEWPNRDDI